MHRSLAVVLALAPGLCAGTLSAQDVAPSWVLPPSSAAPIGRVAGIGEGPIAGCDLEGVAIDRDRARATYVCEGARRVVATMTRGEDGALEIAAAPYHAPLAVVLAHRAREVAIPWERATPRGAGPAPPPPRAGSDPRGYALGVLAFAALFSVVIAWTRRR